MKATGLSHGVRNSPEQNRYLLSSSDSLFSFLMTVFGGLEIKSRPGLLGAQAGYIVLGRPALASSVLPILPPLPSLKRRHPASDLHPHTWITWVKLLNPALPTAARCNCWGVRNHLMSKLCHPAYCGRLAEGGTDPKDLLPLSVSEFFQRGVCFPLDSSN